METDRQSTRKTVDYEKATHKRESMRANKEQSNSDSLATRGMQM